MDYLYDSDKRRLATAGDFGIKRVALCFLHLTGINAVLNLKHSFATEFGMRIMKRTNIKLLGITCSIPCRKHQFLDILCMEYDRMK